jgi:ABC-2 type transport system permease protein
MATMTTSDIKLSALPPVAGRAGLRGVIASEFTKIRSVRSTYWTIAALLIVGVGIAALVGFGIANNIHNQPWNKAGTDGTQSILTPFLFIGQLIIAVIGAMVITSEYSTGMIRTSLTAMPRRVVMYSSKVVVFAVVALVVTFVAAFISFYLGQSLLGSTHDTATLSQPNVLRAIVGSALYVTLCGLFAFAIAAILRHTAGTITTVIGILFVVPILAHLLPSTWYQDVERWLPDAAGRALSVTVGPQPAHLFSPWGQFTVFAVYTAVLLVIGAVVFRNRDA